MDSGLNFHHIEMTDDSNLLAWEKHVIQPPGTTKHDTKYTLLTFVEGGWQQSLTPPLLVVKFLERDKYTQDLASPTWAGPRADVTDQHEFNFLNLAKANKFPIPAQGYDIR